MNIEEIKISIIIRFKNESKFLTPVYEAIDKQKIGCSIEIISVNNNSIDDSREIASKYSDKIIDIEHYEPGVALNTAIEKSSGSIIVVLSAHTIPGNKFWLKNLVSPLLDKNPPLAVYGAQIYPYYSQFLDKRDLDIFNFAPSRKEYKDTDFWNANSAFLRKTWNFQKFCESVYELEDHFWTKEILSKKEGYILFNPDAYVYHYGHYKRIDRKYPNMSKENQFEFLKKATELLSNSNKWSDIMWAALICNSIPNENINDKIINLLGKHLHKHWDFDVRWRIAQTLGNIPNNKSVKYLVKTLSDVSFYPRNEAAWSLRKLLPISLNQVSTIFQTSKGEQKLYAAFVLAVSNNTSFEKKAFSYLFNLVKSGKDTVVQKSLYILGEITRSNYILNAVPLIKEKLLSQYLSNKTLSIAIWCLGRIYENHEYDFPIKQLFQMSREHNDFIVRYEAINSLSRFLNKTDELSVLEKFKELLLYENDDRVNYALFQAIRLFSEKNDGKININLNFKSGYNDFGVIYEKKMIVQKMRSNGTYRN